jgi:ERCC4-related helicase
MYFYLYLLFYNDIDENKKTVRQYQCDISSACLLANTLVCLPTGLGKVIFYNK